MHFPFPQRNLSSDGPLGPQLKKQKQGYYRINYQGMIKYIYSLRDIKKI